MPVESRQMYTDDEAPMLEEEEMETGIEDEGEYPSGTLDKSILMGQEVNVGDRITLEVTDIGEDSVVVSYPMDEGMEEEAPPSDDMSGGTTASDFYT